jgi:hypothetical protein
MRHPTLVALVFALAATASADKPAGRPSVSLRAAPRVAVAPARVVFTVELKGGQDGEALDCLTLRFGWGDGTTSSSEGECAAAQGGPAKVQRLFTADHEYGNQGSPTAEVAVLKGERVVGRASVSLKIGPRPTKTKLDISRPPY